MSLPSLATSPPPNSSIGVSIIIATYDRPESLQNCLQHLLAQEIDPEISQTVEILVIDNHPQSGITAQVVASFPSVVRLEEPRAGAAYARNLGIAASQGKIIVTVDDDVTVPAGWLTKLLKPFARPEVAVVTGDMRALSLETEAEQIFEKHWGLGCGDQRFEVDGQWFQDSPKAVAGWELGVTANAAFRADIFADPEVGMMEETLGTGTPVGAGEDPYLFYRIVRAGYTLVYDPEAYVWHQHRQDLKALRRQTFRYSKSVTAYHLMTLLKDGDRRALTALLRDLPLYYTRRLLTSLFGISDYPVSLALRDIVGYGMGPWCLWRSHRRVKRLGRSQPYVPWAERSSSNATASSPST